MLARLLLLAHLCWRTLGLPAAIETSTTTDKEPESSYHHVTLANQQTNDKRQIQETLEDSTNQQTSPSSKTLNGHVPTIDPYSTPFYHQHASSVSTLKEETNSPYILLGQNVPGHVTFEPETKMSPSHRQVLVDELNQQSTSEHNLWEYMKPHVINEELAHDDKSSFHQHGRFSYLEKKKIKSEHIRSNFDSREIEGKPPIQAPTPSYLEQANSANSEAIITGHDFTETHTSGPSQYPHQQKLFPDIMRHTTYTDIHKGEFDSSQSHGSLSDFPARGAKSSRNPEVLHASDLPMLQKSNSLYQQQHLISYVSDTDHTVRETGDLDHNASDEPLMHQQGIFGDIFDTKPSQTLNDQGSIEHHSDNEPLNKHSKEEDTRTDEVLIHDDILQTQEGFGKFLDKKPDPTYPHRDTAMDTKGLPDKASGHNEWYRPVQTPDMFNKVAEHSNKSDVNLFDANREQRMQPEQDMEVRLEPTPEERDKYEQSEARFLEVEHRLQEPPPPPFDVLQEPGLDEEDVWRQRNSCDCWNTTEDGHRVEVECRCGGLELRDVPSDLAPNVHRITIVHAGIRVLKDESLQRYRHTLREIVLNDVRQLHEIAPRAFHNLGQLYTIYINHAPLLRHLPDRLFDVHLRSLRILRIVHTGLETIPRLHHLRTDSILHMVDLDNNKISRVPTGAVSVRSEQFLLNYNLIEHVHEHAFNESEIAKLSLKGNRKLADVHPRAFVGLHSLRDLDLSKTAISALPTEGLKELEYMRLQDTDSLKTFPSIYNFEYLQEAWLTYPYHCCAFQFPAAHAPEEFAKHEIFLEMIHTKCGASTEPPSGRRRRDHAGPEEEVDFGRVVFSPDNMTHARPGPDWGLLDRGFGTRAPWSPEGVFMQNTVAVPPRLLRAYCGNVTRSLRDVRCSPAPDAFSPCEDLMGNWALRVAVWLVAVSAVVGNLAVLLVLLSSRFRMSVPKFLMCNLALADLCMGVYMLLIAVMDARSVGDYFNYAIDWQQGLGCQVAGCLTVFACQLSIFTLTVITSERWYAITYALHLDKRLRLCTAAKVMAVGWLYSSVMAALPLAGISGYSRTSICLPMENRDAGDLVYLATLLLVNGLAFALICACYGRIYCAISGHDSAAARSDTTVAKRMALLVFTDFVCWAPITFFGLTAVAGYPLINVTNTKILLVFFYPLNSCANPYLYALLTKQYRRDLFTLLGRHGLCARKAARYKQGVSTPPGGRNNTSTGATNNPGGGSARQSPPPECNHVASPPTPPTQAEPAVEKPRSASADGLSVTREAHRGSPHPLRNSNTRLNLSGEQEMILKRVLDQPQPDPVPVLSDSHL